MATEPRINPQPTGLTIFPEEIFPDRLPDREHKASRLSNLYHNRYVRITLFAMLALSLIASAAILGVKLGQKTHHSATSTPTVVESTHYTATTTTVATNPITIPLTGLATTTLVTQTPGAEKDTGSGEGGVGEKWKLCKGGPVTRGGTVFWECNEKENKAMQTARPTIRCAGGAFSHPECQN